MKPRKARDVSSGLERKGFRGQQRDHTFYILWVNETETSVRTKISHGCTELSPSILGQMAKELHLTAKEFEQLVDCLLSTERLVSLLKTRGYLGRVS